MSPACSFQDHFAGTRPGIMFRCVFAVINFFILIFSLALRNCLFYDRDKADHNTRASEMLCQAIVGPEPGKPRKYTREFRLSCLNRFEFLEGRWLSFLIHSHSCEVFLNVLQSFEGGAEL
jgi:hypothetical protein